MTQAPNWAGSIAFGPEHFYKPASVDELQSIIAGSARVRVLGTGHSFNDLAVCDDSLVSLSAMPMTVDADGGGSSVTSSGRYRPAAIATRHWA